MVIYRFRQEKGSVMVEFALVSTMLFMIIIGIIDFGMVFNAQLIMDNAAREGVRNTVISTSSSDSQLKQFILNTAPNIGLTASNITITPTIRTPGQAVTVSIALAYQIPVTFGVLPSTFNLASQAVMVQ